MKGILLLALCCGLSILSVAEFSLKEFDDKIIHGCLDRLYDPYSPTNGFNDKNKIHLLSNSLESFISLVEKLEEKHPEWTIYDISIVLLKRFGYSGVYLDKEPDNKILGKEDGDYIYRRKIAELLVSLHKGTEHLVFQESDLSDDEKCSLYFMLGHLVNTTVRNGIDEPVSVPAAASDAMKTVALRPREQGVVSLRANEIHAIALGKVLFGIIASQDIHKEKAIGDMIADFKENLKEYAGKKIDPLLGVTISEIIAHTAITRISDPKLFGSGGTWNSTVCSHDYLLHETSPGCTLATIRGAIDGFLIGNTLQSSRGTNKDKLVLSRILRMYYDPRGITLDEPSKFTSYCKRYDMQTTAGFNKQAESSEAYYYLYQALRTQTGRPPVESTNIISTVFTELSSQRVMNLLRPDDGFCDTEVADKCETTSDVFVILDDDDKGTTGFDFQAKVISKLSTYLDIGLGAGSIGVYFNSREKTVGTLKNIVHNATNRADAACKTISIDVKDIPDEVDEELFLHALNTTLRDFELQTAENTHANSRAVIVFKYGELKMNDHARIERASSVVRNEHRDTRVLAIGKTESDLKLLTTDPLDVILDDGRVGHIAKDLAERICNIPSVFQYEMCYDSRNGNEGTNTYTGYVTPDYTQYWAMYPEYFHKSYNVEFEFESEGDVDVCFSRIQANPKIGSPREGIECQSSTTSERKLTFKMSNPCHNYNVRNCRPAYFSVTGKRKQDDTNTRCSEKNCRRIDQIQFTFAHKGVSCNGCSMLTASYIMFSLMAIFTYFRY